MAGSPGGVESAAGIQGRRPCRERAPHLGAHRVLALAPDLRRAGIRPHRPWLGAQGTLRKCFKLSIRDVVNFRVRADVAKHLFQALPVTVLFYFPAVTPNMVNAAFVYYVIEHGFCQGVPFEAAQNSRGLKFRKTYEPEQIKSKLM